jgi:hypothetical protein
VTFRVVALGAAALRSIGTALIVWGLKITTDTGAS